MRLNFLDRGFGVCRAAEIDTALITQFSDMVHVRAQQMKSRLRQHFLVRKMTGDQWAYDGIGIVEATEQNQRIATTQFNSVEWTRRQINRRRFVITLPLDSSDVRAMLTNPQNDYSGVCIRAIERVYDRVGIQAAFASVNTGRTFSTAVTAATDGVITVNATAGLTYEVMVQIRRYFSNNEVGNDMPEKFLFLCTGDEEGALMQETALINSLYTRQSVVDQGELTRAVGFELVKYGASVTQPLITAASGTRNCIACSTRGIVYGMSLDLQLKIQERPDLVETTQVQAIIQIGSVRTEGVLVQQVNTTVLS
jgi:hypothetical protein